jgi:outer membrane protein assembly factor BamD (BamD/ComL family)
MSTQDAQQMENIAKDFKKLESDLKSGDLSAAKQDYVTLKSDLPATNSTSSTSSSSQTNPVGQLLTQLGTDLDSGNLSAAQQDFSQIKQQLQNGPQGPPPGSSSTSSNSDSSSSSTTGSTSSTSSTGESAIQTLLDQLEKNLQNGDTTSAKNTLKTLQDDIANMASSYVQSSSTGSTVNTYA